MAEVKKLVYDRTKLLTDLGMPIEFIGLNPIVLANALGVLNPHEEGKDEKKKEIKGLLSAR